MHTHIVTVSAPHCVPVCLYHCCQTLCCLIFLGFSLPDFLFIYFSLCSGSFHDMAAFLLIFNFKDVHREMQPIDEGFNTNPWILKKWYSSCISFTFFFFKFSIFPLLFCVSLTVNKITLYYEISNTNITFWYNLVCFLKFPLFSHPHSSTDCGSIWQSLKFFFYFSFHSFGLWSTEQEDCWGFSLHFHSEIKVNSVTLSIQLQNETQHTCTSNHTQRSILKKQITGTYFNQTQLQQQLLYRKKKLCQLSDKMLWFKHYNSLWWYPMTHPLLFIHTKDRMSPSVFSPKKNTLPTWYSHPIIF